MVDKADTRCHWSTVSISSVAKVEVFDPTNTVVASTIVKANGCVNGTKSTAIKGSTRVNLSFYSMIRGNYKLRFTPVADAKGNGGNWEEALVGNASKMPTLYRRAGVSSMPGKRLLQVLLRQGRASSNSAKVVICPPASTSVRATLRRPLMPRLAQPMAMDFRSKREAIISATTPSDGLEIPM